tara:strand:+ start:365 stop:559 length:195 start_codon:yes stop_codon:yes gene_type:complete
MTTKSEDFVAALSSTASTEEKAVLRGRELLATERGIEVLEEVCELGYDYYHDYSEFEQLTARLK